LPDETSKVYDGNLSIATFYANGSKEVFCEDSKQTIRRRKKSDQRWSRVLNLGSVNP